MKRRYMAIAAVLAAGMLFRTAGMETMAEETVSGGDAGPAKGAVSGGDAGADSEQAAGLSLEAAIVSLQVPQKIEVVIDPWEADGRGQIYSEAYTIRNAGEVAAVLTLSFRCRAGEQGGTVLREDREGLHEGEDKQAYIEILFGDEEKAVLSQGSAEYRATLEPGGELQVRLSGEVNENASEPWQDGDFLIEGIYSWEAAEELEAADSQEE